MVERCAVCTGACAVAGSAGSDGVPALATMDAADALAVYGSAVTDAARARMSAAGAVDVCDGCVALATRWAIADGRPAVGYVNADETAITSWGGAHVARIVRSTTVRNGWQESTILAWSAVLPSGAKCYGRNGGRGMVTNIRPSVARSSRYVVPPGWSITREFGGAPWGRSHVVRHCGTFVSQHETRADAIALIAAEVTR